MRPTKGNAVPSGRSWSRCSKVRATSDKNFAYHRWHEKTAQIETLHLGDEINVDIALDSSYMGSSCSTPIANSASRTTEVSLS